MKSNVHEIIGEALDTYGAKGALREEIYSLIHDDLFGDNETSKRKALSNGLQRSREADLIVKIGERYYLKECVPVPVQIVQPVSNDKHIAPYAGKRTGKTVSIYTPPRIMSDVIALAFLIDERWYKIPLFTSIRICIGQGDPPMWSADQEMYRGVVQIRISHKGGTVTDEHVSPSDIITIAPEE